MKKFLISSAIFIIAIFGLIIFSFAGYSSYDAVADEGDLAMFAKKKASLFLNVNTTGKLLTIHGSAIYKPTATCLYHTQSTLSGAKSQSNVAHIIDINGANISLDSNAKTDISEATILELGYAVNAAASVNNYKDKDNARKQYLRDLLFGVLDKWKPVRFYRSKTNAISNAMRNSSGYQDIKTKAEAYASTYSGKVVPSKQTTTPTIDKTNGYIGPFKVNYGGHVVNSVKLSLDGGGYTDVVLYKDKKGHAYANKEVPKNSNFYVKCTSNTKKYGLVINFSRVEYIAKILLVGNDLADGQNLGVYSARRKTLKKRVVWTDSTTPTPEPSPDELGQLTIKKVDDDTDAVLKGAKFKVTGPGDYANGVEFETNDQGIIQLTNLSAGDYTVQEIQAPAGYNYSVQNTDAITVSIEDGDEEEKVFTNKQYGDLQIIKKDEATNQKIQRAGFQFIIGYVDNEGKAQYIGNGSQFGDENTVAQLNYIEDPAQAMRFQTNADGVTDILRNIPLGTWYVTEVGLPQELNGYYEVDPNPRTVNVTSNVTDTGRTITYCDYVNTPKNINVSGYVWVDKYEENKITTRNNKIDAGEALGGYQVDLYKFENNVPQYVASTTTDGNGYYSFFVNYNDLMAGKFYTQIIYDAIKYQSVDPDVNDVNGSKATERVDDRNYVNSFNTVNSTGWNSVQLSNSGGAFLSSDGVNRMNINYSNTSNHVARCDVTGFNIASNTANIPYGLQDHVVNDNGIRTVSNVNLGIYRIPDTDLAIGHDLDSVTVGINGYWHVYNYGSRNYNSGDSWDIGVRFQNSYTGTYKRAIYKSDIDYRNESDSNRNLQVYLTYKIVLKNESPYYARINNVIEYFDKNYTVEKVGRGLDNNKNVTDEISSSDQGEKNNYKKYIINTNSKIDPGSSQTFYIKFKFNIDALKNSNDVTLNATAEINSYTNYKDAQEQAPITVLDIDSVPGNATPGNVDTYEDDTEGAPPVQLVKTGDDGNRTISGKVFVDSTTGELKTGEIRQGDGKYTNGETGVKDVTVTLHEVNNSITDIKTNTNENGDFSLRGFIPGQYILTYTWGDEKYTVQNYKGTIYDSGRNQNDMYWYKDDVNTRKTDAIDDYSLRKKIDGQTQEIDNTIYGKILNAYRGNEQSVSTKMNSTTPKMEFGVEYGAEPTNGSDTTTFIVSNVDFGIVERARQQLDMRKRVSALSIKLPNGQILSSATVKEDGTLEGQPNYLTYMGPSTINGINSNGFVKAELDNELIEGATLEVKYEIKIVNNSEKDFNSEKYYKYGIQEGPVITLTPSAVVDYLDADWGFETNNNSYWKQITERELKDLNATKVGNTDFLKNRIILYTVATAKPLEPRGEVAVEINVSKLLTTSNDALFKNDTEVTKVKKPSGNIIRYFPSDSAEDVEVIPSTGENLGYGLIITVFVIALLVLALGVFMIIKLVL